MSAVTNVCGLVVHVAPGATERAIAAIAALPGCDVHLEAEGGRLIVTAIDTGDTLAIDQVAEINRVPGIVSTSLAYHHIDDSDDAACCGGDSCAHC